MNLPSLKGLRAVEAALRLGSFALAAGELNVTQTAVSRLVREVELRRGDGLGGQEFLFGRPLGHDHSTQQQGKCACCRP